MSKPTYQDAELLLNLYDLRREALLRKARAWFMTQFQAYNWEDRMRKYPPGSEEERFARMVISYWDMTATLVNTGILNEELFFQTNGEHLRVWDKVKPWIENARTEFSPNLYRNLEEVVEKHLKWKTKQLEGSSSRSKSSSAGKMKASKAAPGKKKK